MSREGYTASGLALLALVAVVLQMMYPAIPLYVGWPIVGILVFWAGILFKRGAKKSHEELETIHETTIVSLHPKILQKTVNVVLGYFKKEPLSLSISYFDTLWILFISVFAWVVGGIGFRLFVDSVFSASPHQVLFLTGALAFSSVLGLIAILAPSGLGVREGALVYLLSFIMPGTVAVIVSIITRIWMTLIEIGLIGVIYLLSKIRKELGKKGEYAKT